MIVDQPSVHSNDQRLPLDHSQDIIILRLRLKNSGFERAMRRAGAGVPARGGADRW